MQHAAHLHEQLFPLRVDVVPLGVFAAVAEGVLRPAEPARGEDDQRLAFALGVQRLPGRVEVLQLMHR
jgi:hypothetical protein